MTAEGGNVHVVTASGAVDQQGQFVLVVVERLVPVCYHPRNVELLPSQLAHTHSQRRNHVQMLTEFLWEKNWILINN